MVQWLVYPHWMFHDSHVSWMSTSLVHHLKIVVFEVFDETVAWFTLMSNHFWAVFEWKPQNKNAGVYRSSSPRGRFDPTISFRAVFRWRTTRCWTVVPATAPSIAGWKCWLPLVLRIGAWDDQTWLAEWSDSDLNGRCGWFVLFVFYVILEGTVLKMSAIQSTKSN